MAKHLEQPNKPVRQMRESGRGKTRKMPPLMAFLFKLLLAIVVVGVLLLYVIGIFVAHTNDMYPALRDGDLCITWKLREPVYGDIVAYDYDGVRRFGRVVGMAGDVIDMAETGGYTLNGNIPNETIYYETNSDPDSTVEYPYTVPEGTVFVLNDLRDNTTDSRRYGAIKESYTDGSVVILLRRRGW